MSTASLSLSDVVVRATTDGIALPNVVGIVLLPLGFALHSWYMFEREAFMQAKAGKPLADAPIEDGKATESSSLVGAKDASGSEGAGGCVIA